MRILVSHAGVAPASTQVALAFDEAGWLTKLHTTFVHRPGPLQARLLHARAGGVRGTLARELGRRALPELPRERIAQYPLRELLRVAAGRAGASPVWLDGIWYWAVRGFDAHVAGRLSDDLDAVYAYELGCRATFERARELGVRCIYDMAAAHFSFRDRIMNSGAARHPTSLSDYDAHMRQVGASRNAAVQAEMDLADFVIANSAFTARTLTATGYPEARVRVVPLGGPAPSERWERSGSHAAGLRCVFAGSIARHKGVPELLEAWCALGTRSLSLRLAGSWELPESMKSSLPPGVELLGRLPRAELFELFLDCDLFVFPSLCDGFAMVVTEAMAHGLPVITTRNVGAADLVEDGVNGWVLEPGDVTALSERIAWCAEHPAELAQMRRAAVETARANQWSDYRARLRQTVATALQVGTAAGGG